MQMLSEYFHVDEDLLTKVVLSGAVLLVLFLMRIAANAAVKRHVADVRKAYHCRRAIVYVQTGLTLLVVGRIWIEGIGSITTFLGLATAGLAIAMHDTIANLAGWIFLIWRQPFKVGDRIEIGGGAGDVIDIRMFQFSMIEIGNWVDADQSTGRIMHVPNSKLLREPLANYQIGFDYIWHEIPVLITFESNWRRAKELLSTIAAEKTGHLSEGAQQEIRQAAQKYFIYYGKLTPIVYTTVRDCGVLLTLRYIVKPRQRRSTEEQIWEAVLDAVSEHADVELAYPTTRFYEREPAHGAQPQSGWQRGESGTHS